MPITPEGNKASLHFLWKGRDGESDSNAIDDSTKVIKKIEVDAPVYERQITKRNFQRAFGFVADPVALRAIFKQLTGDNSAPSNLNEKEIDERFRFAMLSEDSGIMVNLRHQAPEKQPDTFKNLFRSYRKILGRRHRSGMPRTSTRSTTILGKSNLHE